VKGVRCSWVDMLKIRDDLSLAERGDQKRLERMRCVSHSTVSSWKLVCDLLSVLDGKCYLSNISHFQPTHAREIARVFRKREKNPAKWTPEMKEEMQGWVERCEDEQLTVSQLQAALLVPKEPPTFPEGSVSSLQTLIDAGQTFGTIYADPPWKYGNQATRAATSKHYGTMTLADIAALPVASLAAPESHLHLWTTNAFLPDSFSILDAWGFEYKSVFVWCKPRMGLGNYWRVSHEFLVLGVRGSTVFADTSLLSWASLKRPKKHSQKPHAVRQMIEKASPGPRLELFARACVPGWTVWGNQIEKSLFDPSSQPEED
jgi:N6-adenosine-specific RNA methylase IME4